MAEPRSRIDNRGSRANANQRAVEQSPQHADDELHPPAVEKDEQGDFVPDDEQLREAIGEWDAANRQVEMHVNDIGLIDSEVPEQTQAAEAVHAAEEKVRARLTELGYQSVRFFTNLFFEK